MINNNTNNNNSNNYYFYNYYYNNNNNDSDTDHYKLIYNNKNDYVDYCDLLATNPIMLTLKITFRKNFVITHLV